MSFGVPAAFLWSLLAIPIIVFYILKVRLRRIPTSTTIFWNQIFDEKPPRSIWETLKHLLSLLAQIVILGGLVMAVADPFLPGQLKASRRLVVIIDNSASMRATDVAPTRLDSAKSQAMAVVDGLRFGDEMAVVLAGDHPTVVMGMSSHAPTLKRSIEAIAPTDCATNIAPALELGRRLIGSHPHGQLVLFSDGCFAESQKLAADVDLRMIGTAAGNVGITQFQARRSLVDPLGYELLVAVKNASDIAVEGRIEIELAGATVDILPLKLAAGERYSRSLEKTSLDGGRLAARLTQFKTQTAESNTSAASFTDSLASDDTASAILPARKIQNVLLVTPGNLFLQKVLEANRLVKLTIAKELPTEWPADSVVVLHRLIPPKLPDRNVFVVDPQGPSEAWQLAGDVENPIITKQDAASPLMTHLKLDNVVLPKARKLTFTEPPHVLAGAVSGDPVLAALKRTGSLKGVVLPVDLDEGDLAFRTAFPILVTNVMSWFSGSSDELEPAVPTGSIVRRSVPTSEPEKSWRLKAPDGSVSTVVVDAAATKGDATAPNTTVGPLDHVGVWEIVEKSTGKQSPSTAVASAAVNLSNAAETDLRPPTDLKSSTSQASSAAAWFTRPLWFYLAAFVLAFGTVEWFLYQRRFIR